MRKINVKNPLEGLPTYLDFEASGKVMRKENVEYRYRSFDILLQDVIFDLAKIFKEKTEIVFATALYCKPNKIAQGLKDQCDIELTPEQLHALEILNKARRTYYKAKLQLNDAISALSVRRISNGK